MHSMRPWLVGVGILSTGVASANLFVNGDFEAGNSGFSSDYVFTSSNSSEGQYTVSSMPSSFNGAFFNIGDHTSGTGKYMVINGATSGSPAVWRQTAGILPNTTYYFSAWTSTAVGGGPAVLQLKVNGNNQGSSFQLPNNVGSWAEWTVSWNSGASTSATFEIINSNQSVFPNDFYLDDLSVVVPEPASLIGVGIGGLLLGRKKRKKSALLNSK